MEMTARGIVDVVSNRPFRLLVANFSRGILTILKGMVIGRGAGVTGRFVEVAPVPETNKDTTTVHLFHNKPAVSRETQVETAHVAREDDDGLRDNWQDLVTLPDE